MIWITFLAFPIGVSLLLTYFRLGVDELFTRHATPSLDSYVNFPELNNKNCTVVPGVEACEDVVVHGELAFLACSRIADRLAWFPAAGKRNASGRVNWRDPLFRYDLRSGKFIELNLQGVEEVVTHGLAVYSFPDDSDKLHLFVVSHAKEHSLVHIFAHSLSSENTTLVKTVRHHLLVTPNDITPTGPFSFYASNDHKYREGMRRRIEDKSGPWRWSTVVHCEGGEGSCKTVAKKFGRANGVLYDPHQNHIIIMDTAEGEVLIYDVRPDYELVLKQKISTNIAMDNVTPLPSGDALIAGFPDMNAILERRKDLATPCPAMALILDTRTLAVRPIFKEDTLFAMMTTAAIDDKAKVFLGGGVRTKGMLRCEIDSTWNL